MNANRLTECVLFGLDHYRGGRGELAVAGEATFIILVEDDPDISTIAVMSLHLDPHFTVTPMRTGASALQHLKNSPKPDLILIDNNLPDERARGYASVERG